MVARRGFVGTVTLGLGCVLAALFVQYSGTFRGSTVYAGPCYTNTKVYADDAGCTHNILWNPGNCPTGWADTASKCGQMMVPLEIVIGTSGNQGSGRNDTEMGEDPCYTIWTCTSEWRLVPEIQFGQPFLLPQWRCSFNAQDVAGEWRAPRASGASCGDGF